MKEGQQHTNITQNTFFFVFIVVQFDYFSVANISVPYGNDNNNNLAIVKSKNASSSGAMKLKPS